MVLHDRNGSGKTFLRLTGAIFSARAPINRQQFCRIA
jgi:hypothetical protein